jgi:hypothetical protein
MKKIYEHDERSLKSFLIDDVQIDLLESSKKGLLLSINNLINNDTTTVFVSRRIARVFMNMIYERVMLINERPFNVKTLRHVNVSHISGLNHISSNHANINLMECRSGISVTINIGELTCQRFVISSYKDIVTIEHI